MAEAVLSALLQVVFEKISSPILEQYGLLWGVRGEMENLRSTLSMIQAVLEDAEERQVKDKALQNWLGKLKDIAYDADDILDEFTTEALRRKVEIRGCIRNKARDFFSLSNPVMFRLNMGRKIKEIGQKLDVIAKERSNFHLREGERVLEIRGREQTDSFVIESNVYGRDEDKRKLMELLFSEDNGEDVMVIPVIGMGGLGKTTLAQLVYNDTSVERHFNLRMWICVSDDFDVRRLTKAILESATNSKCDDVDIDLLQRRLQEKLSGKKFLLVLDDVWDENPQNWDRLKQYLKGGAGGSKIIVTTRSEKVALIMGTHSPHHLGRLSEDNCWSLFKQRAFRQGRPENPNLVKLGKEIVQKCGGIPLAAKALGGLMRLKTEEREWLLVRESEIWKLSEEENLILPALRLSYNHLPSHLKQCFAYCSIFPKDHIIEKKKLILLWMAEGFIQSSDGSKQMEDIGGAYFNNLLWRSFFQDVQKDDDGSIVWCKMHDLVHDLACDVVGNECLTVQVDRVMSIPNISRRLSLECGGRRWVLTVPKALRRAKNMRTLLLLATRNFSIPRNFSVNFMCLRVLDLSLADVTKELLVSISKLKHLRYLDLSHTSIKALPESISTLYHLQTLRLLGCFELAKLPRDMSKISSLRHLEISTYNPSWNQGYYKSFTHYPVNIGELKFLQTLSIFMVGKDSGCGIRELQGLNLHGELVIQNLENVRCAVDVLEAKLKEKPNLSNLGFSWGHEVDVNLIENVEQTLEGLQPHPNLKRLSVVQYVGVRFPHWMSSSLLPNLIEVSLINCRRCEQLPPLSHLPFLKVLVIRGMDAVKSIGNHFYGGDNVTEAFPSLKELTFVDLPNLEEWSGFNGRKVLPCLNRLVVDRCPKLMMLPCLQSLKELKLKDSNEMLLGSVANLTWLSSLAIEGFKELMSMSDGLLKNHTHLLTLKIKECTKLESVSRELGNLAALESLYIEECSMLVSLPEELQNLTSLRQLWIDQCKGLTSLRLQGLSSLRNLTIKGCQSLTSLVGALQHLTALQSFSINGSPELASLPEGMQHLTSLRRLDMWECQKLTCLPEGLRHLTTLQSLIIGNWESLTALPEWIGNLSSLQNLDIWGCDKLECLPSGFQLLTNLQRLEIGWCPQLEKRCEKEKGEDWQKIAHIPYIQIGYPDNESESPRGRSGCGRVLELKRRCINALFPTTYSLCHSA